MMDRSEDDAARAFDAAFAARAPNFAIRAETAGDEAFLAMLHAAVSPLRDALPPALMAMQARAADAHFASAYPNAVRRIVTCGSRPIGRIMLDWSTPDHSHGVDIAVLPRTGGAVGLALLRAWLDAADAARRNCTLHVLRANPAATIYRRLGFSEVSSDMDAPTIFMERPARG